MKNNIKIKLLFFVLILVIGIGYAYVTKSLKINGTNGIGSNSWIIYFDKIQNESGVVSTETNITNNRQQVNFNINLKQPGEYYEFDVDTVNDGTIDAMIDSLEVDEIDGDLSNYLSFDVTYKDGTDINKCDLLEKHSRKTITVKVKFDEAVDEDELVTETSDLNLKFKINYVQKDVCDSYPTLVVDPNGGKYNGTRKLTKLKVEKNSDTVLDEPIRNGYEFLYFTTENGTPLEKDENNKTTVHVNTSDVKVTAQWEEHEVITKYILTIDPNGGVYDGETSVTKLSLAAGETITLEEPTKENYVFDGWKEVTETYSLRDGTVTMPEEAVTVKAKWNSVEDYVARIENRYYTTIQKAFDAAVTNDKVWLLKSTTEDATNVKDISFDLGGFTVTGTITNSGTLTIDNGKITNNENSPFVNTGTVNVGTKGGEMLIDSIIIDAGRNVNGLTQDGTFNFYDGHIIGQTAVTGMYNEIEEGYYYIVEGYDDSNTHEHWQKAYLTDELDAIVKKIVNGKDVYYKLLQDAVDASSNENPYIYAIDNFRDSHETTIGENDIIVLDIAGFTVEEGAAIINNGTLTIKNTDTTKGSMAVREPIVNNGTLNITDVSISQGDNNKILLENSGNLNITNSTLTGTNTYTLDIKTGGTLAFDNTTTIVSSSSSYGIYNEAQENVTITGGNIDGIYNNGENLTINNSIVHRTNSTAIYSKKGTLNLNNLDVQAATYRSCIEANDTEVHVDGGTYKQGGITIAGNKSSEISNATITVYTTALTNSSTLVLNNNTITNEREDSGDYRYLIKNTGTLTINKNTITGMASVISGNGSVTINNEANITATNGKVFDASSGSLLINGGTIKSISGDAIYISVGGNFNMLGGEVVSETAIAVNIGCNATIKGGTLKGKTYGFYYSPGYYASARKVTIGDKADALDITKPVIIGETYGVYISEGNVEFYDGILKGKTAGYYGTITKILEKHQIIRDQEEINGETFEIAYLTPQKLFVQVGEDKFNSLQDAIDAVGTSGTMKLIDTATIYETATIPSGSTITFDLNGLTLTNTDKITNNGTLTITDNSQSKQGGLTNTNSLNIILQNNSDLTIKEGIYSAKNTVFTNGENSTIIIENGTFESTSYILDLYRGTTATILNGKFTTSGKTGIVIDTSYYGTAHLQIDDGTFISTSNDSESKVISVPANTVINSGTFTNTKGLVASFEASNVTINGGTFESIDGVGLSVLKDAGVTITNCVVHSVNSNAIYDYTAYSNNIRIEGGTFTSDNVAAFYNAGKNTTITGGIFKGKTYGLQGGGDSTDIGIDDNTVKIDSPVFIGETAGIKIGNNTVNFYDGITKGINDNYEEEFSALPDEYVIYESTEIIDGQTYQTAYLTQQTPFLKVGSQTFSSMQKAIDAITTTGTIEVIGNGFISRNSTVPVDKDITLELNGFKIATTQTITNKGKLTVQDNSGANDGKIYTTTGTPIITNEKDLIIDSGTYESNSSSSNSSVIRQQIANSTTIMNGGVINSLNRYDAIEIRSGTVTINDGEINANEVAIALNSNIQLTINGGTISSNNYAISASRDAENVGLTITDGTINGTRSAIHSDWDAEYSMNISGGTITSTSDDAIYYRGSLTITGGTVISESKSGISSEGTITIGNDEGNISVSSPMIQGNTYGVSDNWNRMYFYDGILKGKTAGYNGTPQAFATNATVTFDTEEIDGETYNTAYLVAQTDMLKNITQNKIYTNFQTAFNEVQNNDELIMIDDAISYFEVTIPNKKFSLDLDGHTVELIKKMNNTGEVTIKDDHNGTKGTIRTGLGINMIENSNKLTVEDLSVSTTSNSATFIRNTGEVTMDSVTTNKKVIALDIDGASATVTNCTIYNGIRSINGSTLTLSGNTYNMSENGYVVYSYKSKFTMTGDTITSTGYGIYSSTNSPTDKSIITGVNTNASITNEGNLEISSTNINNSSVSNGIDGNLTMNTIIHTNNSGGSNSKIIQNEGTISLTDYTATGTDGIILDNSGTATLNDFSGTMNRTVNSSYEIVGIKNTGILTFNSGTLNIARGKTTYGVYNTNGILDFISGTINVNNTPTAYGIYVPGGSVTIGTNENPTSLSTTDPSITAVGTTTGIGLKKISGQTYYYDGVVTGSTTAIPEAPTDIPNGHRIVLTSIPNANDYDMRILERVSQ